MKGMFENAQRRASAETGLIWSEQAIADSKELAQQVFGAMTSSPTDIVFERIIDEMFPNGSDEEKGDFGNRMYECVAALAQKDLPRMTQGITPDQFKRFAERFLE
ncbi:MAG: hypothetical protein WC477_03785 [Patescibacteria group bacterium]